MLPYSVDMATETCALYLVVFYILFAVVGLTYHHLLGFSFLTN